MLTKTLIRALALVAVFAFATVGSEASASCPGDDQGPSEPTTFCPGDGDQPENPSSLSCPGDDDGPSEPTT